MGALEHSTNQFSVNRLALSATVHCLTGYSIGGVLGMEGLVLAEVEFPSREKSEEFEPPDWFGKEVTEDIRYKNQNLAQKDVPKDGVMRPQ
jgi:CYTH domain-containing protein